MEIILSQLPLNLIKINNPSILWLVNLKTLYKCALSPPVAGMVKIDSVDDCCWLSLVISRFIRI